MGFRLNVKGQTEEILLDKESILDVRYISETPDDSNARATDLSVILEIKGKILAAVFYFYRPNNSQTYLGKKVN